MDSFDELIGAATVAELARVLADAGERAGIAVDTDAILAAVPALAGRAIKARAAKIADALDDAIPAGYSSSAALFRSALEDENLSGWVLWAVTELAARRAVAEGDGAAFDDGLALLAELTPRFSSEFAIRVMLAADLDRAIPIVTAWTEHPDEHVRRLASEGTRPYLPWASRVPALIARPDAATPILAALYRDDSEYVRRSVANHLNDLSRHAPERAIELAAGWLNAPGERTQRVVTHGLRTLIKAGNPGALQLIGYGGDGVTAGVPLLERDAVTMPDSIEIAVPVSNTSAADARVLVDYVVHYVKANGTLAPKVFKLGTGTVPAGETVVFRTRHAFRAMTTRVHYAGVHLVAGQVNGRGGEAAELTLSLEASEQEPEQELEQEQAQPREQALTPTA